MNVPSETELTGPPFFVRDISASKFERMKQKAWVKNQKDWLLHIENDPRRDLVYSNMVKISGVGKNIHYRVLEIGCGSGSFHSFLSKSLSEFDYLGVDSCEQLLDHFRFELPKNHSVVTHDLSTSPLVNGEYDIVFSAYSIFEFSNLPQIVEIIAENLKPGGKLVFNVFDPLVEFLRHELYKKRDLDALYYNVEGNLFSSSRFMIGGKISLYPYFRALRSVSEYISVLQEHGFTMLQINHLDQQLSSVDLNLPRDVVMCFEKN